MKKKKSFYSLPPEKKDPNFLPALLGVFLLVFVIAIIVFASGQNQDIRSQAKVPRETPAPIRRTPTKSPWKEVSPNNFGNAIKERNSINYVSQQNTVRQYFECLLIGVGCSK